MWAWIQNNGTKILSYLVGTLGIIASTSDIIPQAQLKYWILVIAILTYWRGTGNTQNIANAVVQQHLEMIKNDVPTDVMKAGGTTSKQAGFISLAVLLTTVLLTVAAMLLAGCSSTPTQPSGKVLATNDTAYADGVQTDDLAVRGITTLLDAGTITSAQAEAAQVVTIRAKALLDAAHTAVAAGDSVSANTNVTQATAQLLALSLCLTTKPLTVATFTNCINSIPGGT